MNYIILICIAVYSLYFSLYFFFLSSPQAYIEEIIMSTSSKQIGGHPRPSWKHFHYRRQFSVTTEFWAPNTLPGT